MFRHESRERSGVSRGGDVASYRSIDLIEDHLRKKIIFTWEIERGAP